MEDIPSNDPVMQPEPSSGPAGWLQTWIKAVTKPSEATFVEITSDPNVTTSTAFTWAGIAGLISGLILGIVYGGSAALGGSSSSDTGLILGLICGLPIVMAIVTPISLAIGTALIQWVAKLFKGTGSFDKLLYGFAAVLVPLSLVSAIISALSLIPFVGLCISLFSYAILFYQIYLQIVIVKAVNRFDWGPAIGSVLIPIIGFSILCGCLAFLGAMALAPMISETFNGINQSLMP